ncbi:MAG: hypothetical protein U0795_03560 [Pirellulales bacterium]
MIDVALLTESRYVGSVAADGDWYLRNILEDDRLLAESLSRHGIRATRVDWSDPDVDWSSFPISVFRSTWDYFHRWDEFQRWLADVQHHTTLCNSPPLIAWNVDKHYLRDLAERGIPVVTTRYIERGSTESLRQLLDSTGWDHAVLKPCISGAARHTYRIDRSNCAQHEPILRELLQAESMMLQPFQRHVVQQGEDTLIVFEGSYSHAVRKIAKPGDFRVQDDFGGTVHTHHPTAEQIELAERAMAACPELPAYGRVDMIVDDAGQLAVMELEIIEPELWLRRDPPSADRFAAAIAERLGKMRF